MSTSNLLPRGIPTPVPPGASMDPPHIIYPSPSEDLHLTVKRLLDANSHLQEKIDELEGDKRHFQRKLDEYIRSDMEEKTGYPAATNRTGNLSVLEKEVEHLRRENARLNSLLMTGDREGKGSGFMRGNSRFLDRECNPALLHQLNELQASRSLCIEQHEHKMEMMKLENFRQKEEIERLKLTIQFTESFGLVKRRSSWDEINRHLHPYGGGSGHSSLPESLPSFSSGSSGYSKNTQTTATSGLTSSTANSGSSSSSSSADIGSTLAAEVRKLKKQLDRYKTVNIELDQRLKDANLDLQKFAERRGNWDVTHHMDVERLHSEVSHLRSQLDRALSENSQLRSMRGRQM